MESQEAKLRSTAAAEVPGDCGTCKHAPKRAYIACPRATDGTRNCWEPIDQQKREQKPGWRTTKQVDLVDLAAVQSIIAQEMAGLVPVVLYGINAAACDPKGAYVGNPWPNMPATVTVGGRAFAVGFRLAVREITRYSPEEEADRDNQA